MIFTRWVARGALVALATTVASSTVFAQGATTGGIAGVVTDESGKPLENVQIQVVNSSTGFRTGQLSRANGRYFVQGLEVGPSYVVTARLIGYTPMEQTNVRVTLNQSSRVDFVLRTQAAQLTAVTVAASANVADFTPTRQGVATTLSDTLLRRIPNLDRDFTQAARLAPQVTTQTGGYSAAGSNPRLAQFTIDGANQTDRFGLNSTGLAPGGSTGGRLIPIDAVKEVQVQITPSDIRLGNFAGVLVNAVTRSGTNEFTGGLNYTFRNPDLARDTAFVQSGNLRQKQFGGYLGGPLIKDRLHFFAAIELQDRDEPNSGPSFSTSAAPTDTVNGGGGITYGQIERVRSIAQGFGVDAGNPFVVTRGTPLTNFVGRLDYRVNDQTRFVLRQLVNRAEQLDFSRNASTYNTSANVQGTGFRLTSNEVPRENQNYSTVFQAFTNFASGISNEFTAAYNTIKDVRTPAIASPEISVSARGVNNANSQITFGTEQFSPVNRLEQEVLELTNNVTVPLGAHTLTFGGRFDFTSIFNDFRQRAFGAYKFASIDSLEDGLPQSYSVAYANGPGIAADFNAQMFSLYAQDQWTATPRVTVTGGLRMDVPRLTERPPYNSSITSGFEARGITGVATSNRPDVRALFSPRLGVNWDVRGNQTLQVRASTGMYTGQPPYILLANAYQNTGLGLAFLNCDAALTPAFTTDVDALPTACRGGTAPTQGSAGTAGVNLNDPDFKYPQRFVTTAGFDYQLPWGMVFTGEAIYGRDINGLRIRDLNLYGPRQVNGADYVTNTGRVLYADTITSGGANANNFVVSNNGQRVIVQNGLNRVNFNEGAIVVTNQSKAYNWALTPQLRKRFSNGIDLTAAYTYTRSNEVQAFTSDRAISNWRNGREYAGREDADDVTTSTYEVRHRVNLYGTITSPWRRFPTDLSFEYLGNAGSPVTYTVNGDLNGDGFNGNDPIYIPRDATDPNEIRIVRLRTPGAAFNATSNPYELNAEAAQQFENFISSQECLNSQRGKIMERNTCRVPWQNLFNVSLRQSLPEYRGNRVSVQLDVFNFLNLLNSDWGVNQGTIISTFPQQQALTARNRLPGALENESLVSYEFDQRLTNQETNEPKAYQDLVNSINNVYRMQLTFRYSF